MIAVARREQRAHERQTNYDVWTTTPESAGGIGVVEGIDEICLQPGGILPRRVGSNAEVLLFVREGALAYEDSTGRSGIVQAGEVQHRIEGGALRYRESNASRTETARAFALRFTTSVGRMPGAAQRQRRFGQAELRNDLCLIAAPSTREGSLRMLADVAVYCAILDDGRHVAFEVDTKRKAFVHVVRGTAQVGNTTLVAGDGATFVDERAVSATARRETEILIVDIGAPPVPRAKESAGRGKPTP